MFDNRHVFTADEKEEFSKGNTTTSHEIMEYLAKMCDEQYRGRILADDVNLYLIFSDGQAFKLTLEEIEWSEEYMKSKKENK